MLNSIKTFAITFLVATLIFGLIAWFVVGIAEKTFGLTPNETDESTEHSSETESGGASDTSNESEVPPATGETTAGDTVSGDTTTETAIDPEEIKGESFTMLLVGTDYQPEAFYDYTDSETYIQYMENRGDDSGFIIKPRKKSADSIILIRIDKEKAEIMLSPIPTNLKVQAGGVYTKLGELYDARGAEYLAGMVTSYTGLTIDYYASIDPAGFVKLIDELEGIEFTVPQDMEYIDESEGPEGLEIKLERGKTTLDGQTALSMLRYNGYTDGNISRMKLALDFLKAFIAKMTEEEMLEEIPTIYTTMAESVKTNFSLADLTERLDLIFEYENLTPVTIMYPVTTGTLDGEAVLVPSYNEALNAYKAYKIK